jgi:phage terminase large subunit
MLEKNVELPPKLVPVFSPPRGEVRYRIARGGRGSGKSASFAKMAAIFGYAEPLRMLGTRELQVSIKESFYAEVKRAIESESWLAAHYEIGEGYIRGKNGTEFIFRGLRHNMSSIKSMSKIDIAIVEEAEDVPEKSWLELIPTIREEKSEIWVIYNPKKKDSPTNIRFGENPPKNSVSAFLNWSDNPWFPQVLELERQNDLERMDHSLYRHIWEGDYLQHSNALIFAGKYEIKDFDRNSDCPYQGLDYGFAQDPTAAVRCFIKDECLYISHEAGAVGLDIDETAPFVNDLIPDFERYCVRADSARPETTNYLKRNGIPLIQSVVKWKGSVEDGINFIRSFKKVYIHPECPQTAKEFSLYSYKVDRMSGDILPEIVDAHNHFIDAIRYALQPMIQQKAAGSFAPLTEAMKQRRELKTPRW